MTTAAERSQLQHAGLYDPAQEHDACGVGFVAHIKGEKSHAIVQQGLKILENLDHRGAVGADKLMRATPGSCCWRFLLLGNRYLSRKQKQILGTGDTNTHAPTPSTFS